MWAWENNELSCLGCRFLCKHKYIDKIWIKYTRWHCRVIENGYIKPFYINRSNRIKRENGNLDWGFLTGVWKARWVRKSFWPFIHLAASLWRPRISTCKKRCAWVSWGNVHEKRIIGLTRSLHFAGFAGAFVPLGISPSGISCKKSFPCKPRIPKRMAFMFGWLWLPSSWTQ